MNIGFTGTREGMTEDQMFKFVELLAEMAPRRGKRTLHNGLAVGSDNESAQISRSMGWIVVGYPSDRPEYTCDFIPDHYAQEPKHPLKRNPDIVAASEIMIATPGEMQEVKRSGTWATIREAWRTNTPIYIIYPDGRIEYHGPE